MPRMPVARFWLAVCLTACLLVLNIPGPGQAQSPGPDAPPRPTRLVVTDAKTKDVIERDYAPFARVLSALTGLDILPQPAHGRVEAVEALRTGRVDLVLTGPAEYVVFRKREVGLLLVGLTRPGYHAYIVTAKDSPVKCLADLRGQKVVFGDVGSTSVHLAPMQILADHGLNPLTDLKAIHADSLDGWAAVKRGNAAAMGTSQTYIDKLTAKDPNFQNEMRILAQGPDLPGDLILAGPGLEPPVRDAIRRAVLEHENELLQALKQGPGIRKFWQSRFLPDIRDSDYDVVRRMYATVGFPAYADFLGKE